MIASRFSVVYQFGRIVVQASRLQPAAGTAAPQTETPPDFHTPANHPYLIPQRGILVSGDLETRLLVNRLLCKFGQFFIGSLLLLVGLLKQSGGLIVTQLLRPGPGTAITGHFIMFHLLRRRDQTGVQDGWLGVLAHK